MRHETLHSSAKRAAWRQGLQVLFGWGLALVLGALVWLALWDYATGAARRGWVLLALVVMCVLLVQVLASNFRALNQKDTGPQGQKRPYRRSFYLTFGFSLVGLALAWLAGGRIRSGCRLLPAVTTVTPLELDPLKYRAWAWCVEARTSARYRPDAPFASSVRGWSGSGSAPSRTSSYPLESPGY